MLILLLGLNRETIIPHTFCERSKYIIANVVEVDLIWLLYVKVM